MTIWREFEGWTFEYLDRDIQPEALPGFEGLVRLWQNKRGDRIVPAWSDFDFYDFKGWHERISVYEISYDPFDFFCRLSGTLIDEVFDRAMTGARGSELTKMRVEQPITSEFYEMTCRQMLIARTSAPVNLMGRQHVQVTFVEFPLSDDGLRATHSLEVLVFHGTT